jgi:hypothetical protein
MSKDLVKVKGKKVPKKKDGSEGIQHLEIGKAYEVTAEQAKTLKANGQAE